MMWVLAGIVYSVHSRSCSALASPASGPAAGPKSRRTSSDCELSELSRKPRAHEKGVAVGLRRAGADHILQVRHQLEVLVDPAS